MRTRFKLEYIAADSANNLYIDNFNLNGVLSAAENELSSVSVFPNPLKENGTITLSGLGKDQQSEVIITDLKGSVVKAFVTLEETHHTELQVCSGCYLVSVRNSRGSVTKKIVVN